MPPRKHLTIPRDSFAHHNCERGATRIWWVEIRMVLSILTMYKAAVQQRITLPKVSSARIEKP